MLITFNQNKQTYVCGWQGGTAHLYAAHPLTSHLSLRLQITGVSLYATVSMRFLNFVLFQVSKQRPFHQRFRWTLENGSYRRTTFRIWWVWFVVKLIWASLTWSLDRIQRIRSDVHDWDFPCQMCSNMLEMPCVFGRGAGPARGRIWHQRSSSLHFIHIFIKNSSLSWDIWIFPVLPLASSEFTPGSCVLFPRAHLDSGPGAGG